MSTMINLCDVIIVLYWCVTGFFAKQYCQVLPSRLDSDDAENASHCNSDNHEHKEVETVPWKKPFSLNSLLSNLQFSHFDPLPPFNVETPWQCPPSTKWSFFNYRRTLIESIYFAQMCQHFCPWLSFGWKKVCCSCAPTSFEHSNSAFDVKCIQYFSRPG